MIPDRNVERARRAAAIDLTATTDPLLERVILAHRAWIGVELGAPDAATCAALALQALDGDLLLREAGRRAAYHLCVRTLVMTDRADEARRAIAAMRDEATARGSLRLRAGAAWYASNLALRSGQVAEAENHARLALELVDDDVNTFTGGALMLLLYALAERGEFRRGTRAAAPSTGSTASCAPRAGRSASAMRGRACGWPRATSSARTPRRAQAGRAARAAGPAQPELDAVALDRRAGARPPRPPRGGRRRWPMPRWRWPSASARRCRSPTRCTRAPSPRPTTPRAWPCASAGWPSSRACRRSLQRVRLRLELGSALAYMGRRVEARGGAAPGAGRRRRRRRRAARPARTARARGDRPAPAPGARSRAPRR